MKYFRRTAGYALFDHTRIEEALEELQAKPVEQKIRRCKTNCLRHVTRMNHSRMPNIMLNYRSNNLMFF